MLRIPHLSTSAHAPTDAFSASASESQYLVRDDPKDPSRKLIRQILGAVAEYERGMIRVRLQSGKQLKKERGGYVGGAPRFGERVESGQLVPDEHEQQTLRRARDLRDQGKSLRAIAEQLTSEGLQPRRSDRWHPETIRQVLAGATAAR